MNLSTIILAAGKGTRMKSSIPKALHEVASKPLIGHVINLINNLDTQANVVVTGPSMKEMERYINAEGSGMHCITQNDRLGTGHAAQIGLDYIIKSQEENNSDILVLYADTPFVKADTIKKMYKLLDSETAVVLLGFIAKDPAKYGRLIINNKNELKEIVEFLDCTEEQREINICNSGIILINGKYASSLLDKIKPNNAKGEYYLTDLVKIANDSNIKCKYITIDEFEAVAINSREELVQAEAIIQHQLRKKHLSSGVTLVDSSSVYFAIDTEIEEDVIIYPNVFFGLGVKVKFGCKIKSFSHIDGAHIDENVVIGPFARVRPGAHIKSSAKIGNFVEIKNTTVGERSKINHLAYIGDTTIGQEVNIGAGTITCNYDGFSKHKTTISDGVFIGSNVSLIAPVNISSQSIVGAGSVITENVEEGDIAISRAKQINLKNKAYLLRSKKNKDLSKEQSKL